MDYYQLKVTLNHSKPPIYRKILVDPELKLPKFHFILQIVMGWTNSHLHQFIIDGRLYGEPDFENELELINYKNIKIKDVLKKIKSKIMYEYDFGDSWEHLITFEKIVELSENFNAKCIEGKKSAPPEDCGGIGGFYDLLETIQDPEHEEHESMLEWLDGNFDPTYFDLEDINSKLGYSKKKSPASKKKKKKKPAKGWFFDP